MKEVALNKKAASSDLIRPEQMRSHNMSFPVKIS